MYEIEMEKTGRSPWNNPPKRKKNLRLKKAEKLARQAEHWGGLLESARRKGADKAAEATWDYLRSTLNQLPATARNIAYRDAEQALARVRETHAR